MPSPKDRASNERFGRGMSAMGKADMCSANRHVRFTPESDIKCDIVECPLRAKSGHRPTGLQMDSFSFLGVDFRGMA